MAAEAPGSATADVTAPVPDPFRTVTVETTLGNINVGILEPSKGKSPGTVALCIHGKSTQPEVIWEWCQMGTALQERGVATVCPCLHSCRRTAPADASEEDVLTALKEIVHWIRNRHPDAALVVYGKSWGGAAAVDLASSEGSAILGVVLVCPSYKLADIGKKLVAIDGPVLVLWAKDDDVVEYKYQQVFMSNLKRRAAGEKRSLLEVLEEGGHRIAPFLQEGVKARDKILMWPELAGFLQKQVDS